MVLKQYPSFHNHCWLKKWSAMEHLEYGFGQVGAVPSDLILGVSQFSHKVYAKSMLTNGTPWVLRASSSETTPYNASSSSSMSHTGGSDNSGIRGHSLYGAYTLLGIFWDWVLFYFIFLPFFFLEKEKEKSANYFQIATTFGSISIDPFFTNMYLINPKRPGIW